MIDSQQIVAATSQTTTSITITLTTITSGIVSSLNSYSITGNYGVWGLYIESATSLYLMISFTDAIVDFNW